MTVLWIVICVLFGTLTFIGGFSIGFLKGDSNRTQHGNERLEQGYEKGMKDFLSSTERLLLSLRREDIYKMLLELLSKDYGLDLKTVVSQDNTNSSKQEV